MVRTAQVFDSSALVPLVTNRPGQRAVVEAAIGVEILVPHLADAEVLELELVTYDRAMATAPGIACDVILLES